ncbi:hypothetical protein ACEPPN_009392 [Leptodophora sp. 'Broadleaf-Isolate-01']
MSPLLQRLQNHFAEAWYYFRNPNIPSSGPDRNVEGLVYRDGDDFEAILHSLYSDSVVHSGADATIVNLACLHRVALHRLQRELVQEAIAFKYGGGGDAVGLSGRMGVYGRDADHFFVLFVRCVFDS